jgi:hypothetical protein
VLAKLAHALADRFDIASQSKRQLAQPSGNSPLCRAIDGVEPVVDRLGRLDIEHEQL